MCRYLLLESYPEEQVLFSQGDYADKFYVVLKGTATVSVEVPGEANKEIGKSGPGDCFGELALLFSSNRNATIVVDRNSEFMVLRKEDFIKYMNFRSSDYASQAYNLLNVVEPFLALSFPDKIRLASKMEYRIMPSNEVLINQGQSVTQFYFVEIGCIKLYRSIAFNTNKDGNICFQNHFDPNKPHKFLKIEIDEIGPGKYLGEYEIFNYKLSQYSAISQMQTSVFSISSIDFNLMSQFQLSEVCKNAKPYPSDEKIRESFLQGVQWRVFRKQLVSKLQLEQKNCSQIRDPKTMAKFQYQKDLKQFALKTLSYDKMMSSYLKPEEEENAQEYRSKTPMKIRPFFQNVDKGLRMLRQTTVKPTSRKQILPKINPKVGSDIYNILITR